MKKYNGLIILLLLLMFFSWVAVQLGSTSKSHDAFQSDKEHLFVICTMVKSDVSSARIAENTIMLRQSFESMSPAVIENKKEFITNALASAEDSAELYNRIASKYKEQQIANQNLPYKLETEIDTDTVIKCINTK